MGTDSSEPAEAAETFPAPESAGTPGSAVATWVPAAAPGRVGLLPDPSPQEHQEVWAHGQDLGSCSLHGRAGLLPAPWSRRPQLRLPTAARVLAAATPDGQLLPSPAAPWVNISTVAFLPMKTLRLKEVWSLPKVTQPGSTELGLNPGPWAPSSGFSPLH